MYILHVAGSRRAKLDSRRSLDKVQSVEMKSPKKIDPESGGLRGMQAAGRIS